VQDDQESSLDISTFYKNYSIFACAQPGGPFCGEALHRPISDTVCRGKQIGWKITVFRTGLRTESEFRSESGGLLRLLQRTYTRMRTGQDPTRHSKRIKPRHQWYLRVFHRLPKHCEQDTTLLRFVDQIPAELPSYYLWHAHWAWEAVTSLNSSSGGQEKLLNKGPI